MNWVHLDIRMIVQQKDQIVGNNFIYFVNILKIFFFFFFFFYIEHQFYKMDI